MRNDALYAFGTLGVVPDGAALSKDLSVPQAALVIRKGFHKDVDSYSAFTEADGKTTTGLAAYLKARNIKRVFVASGVRYDLAELSPESPSSRMMNSPPAIWSATLDATEMPLFLALTCSSMRSLDHTAALSLI